MTKNYVPTDIVTKSACFSLAAGADLLPNLPSFIRRVCSGYAPDRGVLRTQSV